MLRRKIVLWVLGLVTALALSVGSGYVAEALGISTMPTVQATNCSGGNGGGGC